MDFRDYLKRDAVILFDGAMGTELARRGLAMSGLNNLSHPDRVLEIHRDYLEAGAEVIITNTFTMNRINIASHGLEIDVREVNLAGAGLARRAAGGGYVCGDLSSTGQLLEPYGSCSEKEFYDNFKEQAAYLAAGGVDGFIVETMTDLREALCALRACKDVSDLPVIVSLAFSHLAKGGRTIMGDSVSRAAAALEEGGAEAVGANCGDLDPLEMAAIAELFKRETALPIMIMPNAGKPKLVEGETVFDMGPEEFTEGLLKCVAGGASIVGGCCGTGPAHIRAAARSLGKKS